MVEAGTKINATQIKKHKKWQRFLENFELTSLALPGIVCYLIWSYLPMFGVVIAFKRFNPNLGILNSPWIGLKNFEFFFTSQDALRITINTVGYGIAFMITGILSAVLFALILFEIKNRFAIKTYQTIILIPHFISWVIAGYISYILLNPSIGVINHMLSTFGVQPVQWYAEPSYWPGILTIANIWKHVGMSCIVYYAALLGIDPALYEAAHVDGATKWQQRLFISIPSLIPLMIILSTLSIGNIFKGDFGLFYQISRDVGTLYPTTDIIDTYIYRGLRTGDMGITSAVGLFQSIVGLALVVGVNSVVKRIDPERSLF